MKTTNTNKYDYLVFWSTCFIYLFFISLVVSVYTPLGLYSKRYINKFTLSLIYQFRWNVYVKRPGEPIYQIYDIKDGNLVLNDLRSFTPKYNFGLKRDYKIIATETDVITNDSAALSRMKKYIITIPADANLGDYIKTDTLVFNDVKNKNVVWLNGKYVISIEEPIVWEKMRQGKPKNKTMTVLAVNITH